MSYHMYATCSSNADNGCRKDRRRGNALALKNRVIDLIEAIVGVEWSAHQEKH